MQKIYTENCNHFISIWKAGYSVSKAKRNRITACYLISVGVGEEIRNIALAKKMVGLLANTLIQYEITRDDLYDETTLQHKAKFINTKLITTLNRKRRDCFFDNQGVDCGLTTAVKKKFGLRVTSIFDKGKEFINELNSQADFPVFEFGERRRLLVSKSKQKSVINSKIFKSIRTSSSIINQKIRNFNGFSRIRKARFFRGTSNLNMSNCIKRCEHKFGKGNCVIVSKVTCCFKCKRLYTWYLRENQKKCGCRASGKTLRSMGTPGMAGRRLLPTGNRINNLETVGVGQRLNWQERINDASYYRVEDGFIGR